VQSARDDNRVALSEVDDAHPGGSVFVAQGTGPVKVANTAAVMDALRNDLLEEVSESKGKAHADKMARVKMGDEEAARIEKKQQEESDDPLMQHSPAELAKIAGEEGVDLDDVRKQNSGKLSKTMVVTAINEHRKSKLTPVNSENVNDETSREGDRAAAGMPGDDE
jgi:hypothetical protein